MRGLILFLLIFGLAFAEEENIVSESNEIPPKIQKVLGIKTTAVHEKAIDLIKKYPAIVKEDLTLVQKIYSPVDGIVKKLLVKKGDTVKKGQILAYVYSPEIAKITTQINQARVKYETLKKLYEKEKQLYDKKLITYTRFYSSKINYENAKANLKALQDSLRVYGEVSDGFLILRSKINGYITDQNVVLGDSVDIDKMLFRIYSDKRLWVIAAVPVEDTPFIKKGAKAQVISQIGKISGIVDYVSKQVDPETKMVNVRIIADNHNHILKPNMYVDVKIPLRKIKGLFVPASAVVENEGKHFVFVEYKENNFKPVEVRIGERINGYYQILSGLQEGQKIVVQGAIHLKSKFFGEAEE
ncbi:efflux RND transporter periplasmic adaptor subunit [Persephonella sp.]|uniref:efflux RND transporter periplasmic adaptor subunit n=1 Tax=Persephonella sp. TaxID=2060922 RepID=UPI00262CDB58|nr:efflux RND transporter periplasmic adaptor subunit [Persephonella sp.]